MPEARRVCIKEEAHDALTGHREGRGWVSRDYGEFYLTSVLGPAIDTMLSPFDIDPDPLADRGTPA